MKESTTKATKVTKGKELRVLPDGWVWTTLEKCVDILDNLRNPINSDEREQRIAGKEQSELYPYYGATGLVGWIDNLIFDEEIVLLGEDGAPFLEKTKNKAYIVRGKCWVNNHAHVLRAKKDVTTNLFLMHYLNIFDYHNYVSGTTRLKLNQGRMREIPVVLPPLQEQERIVARLEELLSDLEAGVAALERVRAGVKRYKASVLKSACEGKLFGNQGSGNQELGNGELPVGWRWTTLNDVCGKIQDGTHFSPKVQFDEPGAGRYLYITAKNIKEHGIILKEITYIDQETHRENTKRCDPRKGDVLLIKDGVTTGVATVNQLEEEFTLLSSVALLRSNRDLLDPCFLKHYLNSPVGFKMITGEMTGTAIKRIILAKIKNSRIPLPPLEEQRRIVAEVERRLESARAVESAVEVGLKRAARLRQAVLRSAFEGRLVPQNPNDEPAEHLLERMKVKMKQEDLKLVKLPCALREQEMTIEQKRQPLYDVLITAGVRLTPEQLFSRAGFTDASVDEFYEELRTEIKKGRINQIRPNEKDVFLEGVSS